MPTPQKIEIVNELTQKFQNSSGIYFTRYSGMNVAQATDILFQKILLQKLQQIMQDLKTNWMNCFQVKLG